MCWCPPRCGAPLRSPRGVVCPPVVGACPVCCPPLRWALAPCAGAPPRCCGPDRDHCYDRLEATAPHAFIRSLHGDTRGAATHTPTGRVSGGLGRCTPSSTARSRRLVSRAVVQQPVAATATAPLPTCLAISTPDGRPRASDNTSTTGEATRHTTQTQTRLPQPERQRARPCACPHPELRRSLREGTRTP